MTSRSFVSAATLVAAVFLSSGEGQACCPGEPHQIPLVAVAKLDGGIVRLQWVPQSGFFSDTVRGSLRELGRTGGDFRAAVDACVGEDRDGSTLDDAAIPPPGEGFWYLIRADQRDGCPGGIDGSYDSLAPPLAEDRDLEIVESGRACTCNYGQQGYGCTMY